MGLLTLALLIDIFLGDPDWLWRRAPHPVVLIGNLIDRFDKFRDQERFTTFAKRLGLSSVSTAEIALGALLLVVLLVLHGRDKQAAAADFQVAQGFSEGAGDALLVAELDPMSDH